jgi:hypothetical protein
MDAETCTWVTYVPDGKNHTGTLAGVPWMFSRAPSDAAVARVLVEDMLSTLNNRGDCLALLTVTDHESRMTTREVLREFSQRQRPPDFRFEVQTGAHNIVRQLAALTEARPDVILIVAGAEDAARLVRAVRGSLPGARSGWSCHVRKPVDGPHAVPGTCRSAR